MKIKNSFIVIGAIALAFSITTTAYASSVVRTGQTVSVAEDQSIEGDFYTAANIVNISGFVDGDLVAAGGRTTINGEIAGEVIAVGGSVDVHGSVGDDVRVVGAEVVIAEPVTGDVFVLGGTVTILSTASVGGDVLVFGGEVEIAGPVGGDVISHAGSVRIDSSIAGDLTVTTEELTLGSRANIEGTVAYTSANLLTRSQEAVVVGDVVRNDPVTESENSDTRSAVMFVLMMSFTVLVWFLLSRTTLNQIATRALSKNPRQLLIGSGVLFLAPIAAMILLVSMLGAYVGVTLLFVYILLLLLSIVAVVPVTGQLFLRIFNQPVTEVNLYSIGLGVSFVILLLFVPVLGQLVLLGLLIITLGAISDTLLAAVRNSK